MVAGLTALILASGCNSRRETLFDYRGAGGTLRFENVLTKQGPIFELHQAGRLIYRSNPGEYVRIAGQYYEGSNIVQTAPDVVLLETNGPAACEFKYSLVRVEVARHEKLPGCDELVEVRQAGGDLHLLFGERTFDVHLKTAPATAAPPR